MDKVVTIVFREVIHDNDRRIQHAAQPTFARTELRTRHGGDGTMVTNAEPAAGLQFNGLMCEAGDLS